MALKVHKAGQENMKDDESTGHQKTDQTNENVERTRLNSEAALLFGNVGKVT